MSDVYRIFGSENSPYSVKVRSYFRYKGIPHEWIPRSMDVMEEYQKYARLPIIPAVATPQDEGLQDSTPIIEKMEALHPDPSVHPEDTALAFISALLEEFGDEWGNKWMFHYRWAREIDQKACARRLVSESVPGISGEQLDEMSEGIRARMVTRGFAVGSNEKTADLIEQSYTDGLAQLEKHLAGRPFLFGKRPVFGDFGLWGQLYEAMLDPTAGGIMKDSAPAVSAYCERMLDPRAEGDLESWDALAPTLEPFLSSEVRFFLAWSDQNAQAIGSGAEEMSAEIDGKTWWQTVGGPQKYHAKSLKELRRKYSEVSGDAALTAILEKAGCREYLAGA